MQSAKKCNHERGGGVQGEYRTSGLLPFFETLLLKPCNCIEFMLSWVKNDIGDKFLDVKKVGFTSEQFL